MATPLLFLLVSLGLSDNPVDIRFQPDSVLFVYENAGAGSSRITYSSVIQNLAIVNKGVEAVTIEGIEVSFYKSGRVFQSRYYDSGEILSEAKNIYALHTAGYLAMLDFQYHTTRYLSDCTLSDSVQLTTDQSIIITQSPYLFDQLPDSAVVLARYQRGNKTLAASRSIRIVNHQSSIDYILPLRGTWTAGAAPTFHSHHRWGIIQEFAFDFVQYGAGNLTHRGDGTRLTDYYAYNAPVLAIADGTIVSVLNDVPESDEMLRRKDETDAEYMKRTMAMQQQLLSRGFEGILGNHVIIQHENGEFSFYLHMKTGSVIVKVGDVVSKGQEIGKLGNSGNSTEPHLHFHVSNGADIQYSRSLPVSFQNIRVLPVNNKGMGHIHSGQVVQTD